MTCCCSLTLSSLIQFPLQKMTCVPGLGSTTYLALTSPPSSSSHSVLSLVSV